MDVFGKREKLTKLYKLRKFGECFFLFIYHNIAYDRF